MRILTMTRWSDGSKEYFTLRTDSEISGDPKVTISWQDEGLSYISTLRITAVYGATIEGFLEAELDGSFILSGTIGVITIEDESGSTTTPPTEKPIAPGGSGSMIAIQYDEPASVRKQYYLYTFSDGPGYTGMWTFSNRLADTGNSGIALKKTVANGWAITGIEAPEVATEERITELLGSSYDENSTWGNRCYLVGNQVVFLRSNPSGNYQVRRNISNTYSWEVISTISWNLLGSESEHLEQASYDHLVGYRAEAGYYQTIIDPPEIEHFQAEIDSIYALNYPEMGTSFIDGMSVYVPEATQDRAADQHFSVPINNHNRIEGYDYSGEDEE